MIKKVLNSNSPFDVSYDTAKPVKEAHYSFKAGEDHYCYYRTWGWHQVIASLMEGLISLSAITVFSTTKLNYGYKVPLKNSERKKHISSLNNIYPLILLIFSCNTQTAWIGFLVEDIFLLYIYIYIYGF